MSVREYVVWESVSALAHMGPYLLKAKVGQCPLSFQQENWGLATMRLAFPFSSEASDVTKTQTSEHRLAK